MVYVTRNEFEVIGLWDHSAFEDDANGCMTGERQKLWATYQARSEKDLLPGQIDIGGVAGLGITMSSQPLTVIKAAQRHIKIIREIDESSTT